MKARKAKPVGEMTPRELLYLFAYLGFAANVANASGPNGGHVAHAKGPRGIKRRAKAVRRRAHVRQLQRNSWRSHFEAVKKEQTC